MLTDHLGSVNVVLNANGSVRSRLRYDPWGKQRYAENITPTGYRYTAQRFDDKLGLYDYQARYYDPAIGRFISPDTIVPGSANPQAFNRFAYVLNNPLLYADPSGHLPVVAIFLAFALISTMVAVEIIHPTKESNYDTRPANTNEVNLIVTSSSVDASLGPGVGLQGATFFHTSSQTYAHAVCSCTGLGTPNAGAAFPAVGWRSTDHASAADAAKGLSRGTTFSVGYLDISHSKEVASKRDQAFGLQPNVPSANATMTWGDALRNITGQPPPGTTVNALGFSASVAPVGLSQYICSCSVTNSGAFRDFFMDQIR